MKCDCSDRSILDCVREAITLTFGLIKTPGFRIFFEPETIFFIKKYILKIFTFYIHHQLKNKVDFNGETMTFTLLPIKI